MTLKQNQGTSNQNDNNLTFIQSIDTLNGIKCPNVADGGTYAAYSLGKKSQDTDTLATSTT